jgi:type III secretion system (T3SS) SseB-like protein
VRFLREQDGTPERLLKSHLVELFARHAGVRRAYLAQIRAGDNVGVALCISNVGGAERSLAQDVGAIFASIFGAHEHLDILFLSEEQEASLERVCSRFFSGPADR